MYIESCYSDICISARDPTDVNPSRCATSSDIDKFLPHKTLYLRVTYTLLIPGGTKSIEKRTLYFARCRHCTEDVGSWLGHSINDSLY